MRALRLGAVVVTSAVLVAALAACGSSGKSDAGTDPKSAADAIAGQVADLDPKAALAASALVMQKAGNGSISVVTPEDTGTGAADWRQKLAVDLSGQGSGGTKARVVGDDLYLGGGPATAALGGKHWARTDPKDPLLGPTAGVFLTTAQMVNPVLQLTVAAQAGKPTKVGPETVDGVQTTHFHAVEDAAKLVEGLGALSADQRAAVQKTLAEDGKTLTVDLWINAKQELVQLKEYGDKGGEKSTVTVKYSGLGAAPKIEAPAASDVGKAADLAKLFN
ncbi:hypothetical protein RMN57_17020 [Kitasatospora sp. CM 4170]|uniref:Lipoprotein n=1 Tax=Kitasatospora aburaviensis TaxID=67265 RepID=A0ABW1ETG1_9ACTN|nr:hypothetical protein [Kitasatospora sp. CM 4170]WNM46282.1 hypothetical protein RMN57_17020 [Kitasatospora sp. CM 4170]